MRDKSKNQKKLSHKIGAVVGSIALIFLAMGIILCGYFSLYIKDVIKPQAESANAVITNDKATLSSIIYYYNTKTSTYEPLQSLYSDENRQWVPYSEIPQNLINATVAIEDKRFYDHNGVDWKRTGAAILYMFTGRQVQGGSTITQQLIKNITQQDQVTIKRKVLEIFEAKQLEKTHSKEEILEMYLNEIYLGRKCYGVLTAARLYYDKELSDLDLAESASLISITNNPSMYDPYTKPENNHKRARAVLIEMCKQGFISEDDRDKSIAELGFVKDDNGDYQYNEDKDQLSISLNDRKSQAAMYSWYTDAVISQVISDLKKEYNYDAKKAASLVYSGGVKIYSCYNADVQNAVDKVYKKTKNVSKYKSKDDEQLQSAITVVDNKTGAVVALSGGIGEKTGNRIWNRATDTVRQPGSTIKPLAAYAQAIEKGEIMPNSIMKDSAFSHYNGSSWPKNDDGKYRGDVDMVYAMNESLNTIAVKVLDKVGLEDSYNFLKDKFHFTSLVDKYKSSSGTELSDIGYAQLALGGLTKGVSTYEMAAAYSTFPRNGIYIKPFLYTAVMDSDGKALLTADGYTAKTDAQGRVIISGAAESETILSATTCYYTTEMLKDVVEEGTGQDAKIDGLETAGKTGTTSNDYDRWFAGYTPSYTGVVWCGYDKASQIPTSTNPAVELWQKVMKEANKDTDEKKFNSNFSTTDVTYCTKCGGIATPGTKNKRTMPFIVGEEPADYCKD